MKIHIRNAKPEEYGAVEAIMKQVQTGGRIFTDTVTRCCLLTYLNRQ